MIEIKTSKWTSPTSILVGGASGSGKTSFTAKLIENRKELFDPPPKHVMYFFKVYQKKYDNMKQVNPEIQFMDTPPTSLNGFKDLVEGCKKDGLIVVFGM